MAHSAPSVKSKSFSGATLRVSSELKENFSLPSELYALVFAATLEFGPSKTAPLYLENGRFVFMGDGVKQSKEARRMPGVKRMHQESENSGKAASIFGHLFGGLGILTKQLLSHCSYVSTRSLDASIRRDIQQYNITEKPYA